MRQRFASSDELHAAMLRRAALLALRSVGDVEPNPPVGCVIGRVARDDSGGVCVETLGAGHHRKLGGDHAEIDALKSCRRQGRDPRGAIVWTTLEPCAHHGKTPPCAQAIIDAGAARVVYAAADAGAGAGGADMLRAAGVDTLHFPGAPLAQAIAAPFRKRREQGLPWVIAKWAQTLDGKVADRAGASQWISGAPARRRAHQLRSRVDAIMVGAGTLLADDPTLTARNVRRVRRIARRAVVDPRLRAPLDSRLTRSIGQAPVTVFCSVSAGESDRAAAWRKLGAEVVALSEAPGGGLDLRAGLAHLVSAHDATTALVEGGPRLLGALFDADLVDEALVFVAPRALADADALPATLGSHARSLEQAGAFSLARLRRVGDDAMLHWKRSMQ